MRWPLRAAGISGLLLQTASAVTVNLADPNSVRGAASTVAFGLLKYYTGNNTGDVPGNLPDPYFWWEAGAMFGTLIDYWYITGDSTYNDITMQAMLHQVGEDNNYMPKNQSRTEGNDDQGFWAMAAMSAAENNFPNPPEDKPQWLALVQAVFNLYATRWDTETCGGGLRWQIFNFNNGFNYKNTISNGCFFNLAARLARYTGNQTYASWAEKVYDWQTQVGFIKPDFRVEDGAHVEDNCAKKTEFEWSYNAGITLHGVAVMYNLTGSETWKARLNGHLQSTQQLFFNNSIAFEQACEPFDVCNIDQRSFKGYLMRWLAGTIQMAPETASTVAPLIDSSAQAAAASCNGAPPTGFNGIPGTACGLDWTVGTFDGLTGVGEQMNALSALMYTQIRTVAPPFTALNGGTSVGDPDAGMNIDDPFQLPPILPRDKAAASFLTIAICLGVIGGSVFVIA